MSNFSATQWTVAPQAPLSMEFPRQEYRSELPFPSLGNLPKPGIKHASPTLAGGIFTIEPLGSPISVLLLISICSFIVFSRKLSTSLIPGFNVAFYRVHPFTHTSLPDLTINFCYSNHYSGKRFRVESWLSYLQKCIIKLFSISKAQFSYQTIHFARFYAF